MFNTNLLATLLEEAFTIIKQAKTNTRRNYQFPKADNLIKVATGMRRSGKSSFLFQTINDLLDQGVSQEQILLINFEDDRLLPMSTKEMGALIDCFYSLYPENHQRCCYLFLDEVQNVPDWHLVVRRYFDSKNTQIYLTGSSAKLLSKEINTSLRGRSLALEIFPFSFQEFLNAHQQPIRQKPLSRASLDFMQKQLLNYLSLGGFPAVQFLEQNEWRATLQNYVDTVILKDIIERHKLTNVALLKYLITSLLKNSAAPFAINKFYNDIKSQGYKVSKDTLHNYLEYIQDTYLIFSAPAFLESTRARQTKPKKIYAIDSGLINAVSINPSAGLGHALENLIFLDLKRQEKEIYYYNTASGYEIDFLTIDKQGQRELIQVCWDIENEKTAEREQRAIQQAEKELGIKGRVITATSYLSDMEIINK
jgi:predicted AAA+ superfamily ATPase